MIKATLKYSSLVSLTSLLGLEFDATGASTSLVSIIDVDSIELDCRSKRIGKNLCGETFLEKINNNVTLTQDPP
jgi:hypothetical protein